jgi:hypothetical protein
MAKVSFDGINKLIVVTDAPAASGTSLDVKSEIYSAWKRWLVGGSENLKYLYAMRSVGGDPTVEGRFLGSTFFLSNGWRIRPYEADHTLRLDGNLFTDEGEFVVVHTLGDYNVLVDHQFSNLIDSTVSTEGLRDIKYSVESARGAHGAYGDRYFWDPYSGSDVNDGTTPEQAVATFARAHELVADGNNDVIYCLSKDPSGITTATEQLNITKNGLQVRGGGGFRIAPDTPGIPTVAIAASGVGLSTMQLTTAGGGADQVVYIHGAGEVLLEDLNIKDASGIGILVDDVQCVDIKDVVVCSSQSHNVCIRGPSSRVILKNADCSDSINGSGLYIGDGGAVREVELDVGCRLSGNNQYGLFISANAVSTVVNVEATVRDNYTGNIENRGTNTYYTGVPTSADYSDGVYLDRLNGVSGSLLPVGTSVLPVNNLDDARKICTEINDRRIKLRGSITLQDEYQDFSFQGIGILQQDIIYINGQVIDGSYFERIQLTGAASGSINCDHCLVNNMSGIGGIFVDCGFQNGLGLGPAGSVILIKNGSFASDPSIIDMVGPGRVLKASCEGDVLIQNLEAGAPFDANISLGFKYGTVELDSSCTGGSADLNGLVIKTDGSGSGCTVTGDAISLPAIDTQLSTTHGSGSWEGGAGSSVWTVAEKNQIIADVKFIKRMEEGQWELTNEGLGTWAVYEDDNVTLVAKFETYDAQGNRTNDPTKIVKRVRII